MNKQRKKYIRRCEITYGRTFEVMYHPVAAAQGKLNGDRHNTDISSIDGVV